MDAGGLAHTLKPLVRDGLVEIGVDPKDRRNRLIRLTSAGREAETVGCAVGRCAKELREGFWRRPDEGHARGDRVACLRTLR